MSGAVFICFCWFSLLSSLSNKRDFTTAFIYFKQLKGVILINNRYAEYLEALKTDFTKIAKLEFLNPNGSVAFAVDNNPRNSHSGAFLQEGTLTCNLQNGKRRQATVTLANIDGEFDYAVNNLWFGQQVRLSEGLILPDGTDYYISQGVFELETPKEDITPAQNRITYSLTDKWSNLDGTLLGNLEDVYEVDAGTNIFEAMASILKMGKYDAEANSDYPIDPVAPLFTNYYNDKSQTLTDGTVVSMIEAPYDYISESTGTYADVLLGLAEMLAAWIGYNSNGRLVIDASQDDIDDADKPVLWDYTTDEKQLLSVSYTHRNTEVYNDIIVVGATGDDNTTPRGRAQDTDPTSKTCISRVGLKTKRFDMQNYYSDDICQSYAEWMLKRYSVLQKSVSITSTQMFHITENSLISIKRPDKKGSPKERHLIQSFSRPIGQTGGMTIEAVSVNDLPRPTITYMSFIAGIAIAGWTKAGTVSSS